MTPSIPENDVFDSTKTGIAVAPVHEHKINRRRRVRSVSFRSMVTVYPVLSCVDYTQEEVDAAWYTPDDMTRLKEEMRSDAKIVDSGQFFTQEKRICIRGLESRTKEGIKKKRKIRMYASTAVFFELIAQFENNYFDDEMIAKAYSVYSEPCAKNAHEIGKRDESEAMKIHNRNTNSKNSNNNKNNNSTKKGFGLGLNKKFFKALVELPTTTPRRRIRASQAA